MAERIGLQESFVQIARRLFFEAEAHSVLGPGKASRILVNVVESFGIDGVFAAKRHSPGLFIKLICLNIC